MEAEHLLTVPSPGEMTACTAAAVGLHGPEVIAATADDNNRLFLHRPFCNPPEKIAWNLTDHSTPVELLAFSSSPPLQLASVSQDTISIWQLETAFPLTSGGGSPPPLCDRIAHSGGDLVCVCFSSSGQYLAVAAGSATVVLDTQTREEKEVLESHTSTITSAIFHPHHSHTLITTSLDRTFKVWDVERGSVIYHSPVMSSHPLTMVAVDHLNEVLAVADTNGKVWQLDMSPRGGYKPLLVCNVWRERDRYLQRAEEEEEEEEEGEAGTAIIGLHYWCQSSDQEMTKDILQRSSDRVLGERGRLLVIGHTSIIDLDPNTLNAVSFLEFRDPIPSHVTPPSTILPVACSCHVITCLLDNQVYMVIEGMFEKTVCLLSLSLNCRKRNERSKLCNGEILSFLSSDPPESSSPLRSEFVPKPHPPTVKPKQASSGGRKMRGRERASVGVIDRPVTFKNKIKSSGYTTSPRMGMFTPNVSSTKSKPLSSHQHQPPSTRERRLYPTGGRAPTDLLCRLQPSSSPSTITSLSFSGDGKYISCGSSDRALYLMKMPPSDRRIQAFTGHDGTVSTVGWSHSGQLIVTGSADRTAKLWTPSQTDPLLSISHIQSCITTTATGCHRLPAPVSSAAFYYLDKFLLLSSSNSLFLFKYHINSTPVHDIKRYQNNSRYKLVQALPMKDMQNITCVASINDFLSHLVVVGGSNKNVEVLDMNIGRSVRTMTDCHTRQPHCISLNKGSRGVSHPEWTYDLFLTSAISDGVKLWDLRSNRCVRRLSSHVNRCHTVSAEFSPCSRFIATGSEDRSVYMYDLRTLSPLQKISGHSETVSSVSFHPLTPTLATGTLSGHVTFYTQ